MMERRIIVQEVQSIKVRLSSKHNGPFLLLEDRGIVCVFAVTKVGSTIASKGHNRIHLEDWDGHMTRAAGNNHDGIPSRVPTEQQQKLGVDLHE